MKVLVTGGAGLVGSSVCRKLLQQGASVFCVDNFTMGTPRHLEDFASQHEFQLEQWDVSQRNWHHKLKLKNGEPSFDLLIHLAANSDISLGHAQPEMDMQRTFQTTFETLLAAKDLRIPNFIFSSTSAVYGKNLVFPTAETTSDLHPVSVYGAGKLASEAFISSFVENYNINAWVYRFGNVVGRRLTHGVIYDFLKKLRANSEALEVLGNGQQTKTYIDVEDCVDGIFYGFNKSPAGKDHKSKFQVFNLSTQGMTSVHEIAEETNRVVTQGKGIIKYGSSSIGWVGDVAKTSLDISRMTKLGWAPRLDSNTAVFQSIRDYYEWSKQK